MPKDWDWDQERGWYEVEDPATSRMKAIPTSQNGYVANDRSLIATMTVAGVQFPVRRGPCGELLMWAANRWHHEVEPLVPGTCWGYAERDIRGSTETSNHASGTAIDLNAPKHPLGTNPGSNFTAAQIAAIRRIVGDTRGALRWGGDYVGRKDGMHLEINAPESEVAAVLAEVTNGAVGMPPNTVQQIDEMHEQLLGVVKAWGGGVTDDKGTPYNALMLALRNNVEVHQCALMLQRLLSLQKQLPNNIANQVAVHPDMLALRAPEPAEDIVTVSFWKATAERMVRAAAAAALPLLGAGSVNVLSAPWETVLGLSGGAAVVSLLMSLVGSQVGKRGTPSLLKEGN